MLFVFSSKAKGCWSLETLPRATQLEALWGAAGGQGWNSSAVVGLSIGKQLDVRRCVCVCQGSRIDSRGGNELSQLSPPALPVAQLRMRRMVMLDLHPWPGRQVRMIQLTVTVPSFTSYLLKVQSNFT